jgi:hypothetical protein
MISHPWAPESCVFAPKAGWRFGRQQLNSASMAQPEQTKSAITPRREDDFPEWYQQVIRAAS